MPLGVLQTIVSLLHSDMKSSEQCSPGMAIVASMHERLLTLSTGTLDWSVTATSGKYIYFFFLSFENLN